MIKLCTSLFYIVKYKNETPHLNYRLECYCDKVEGYQKTQDHIQQLVKMLDIFAPTYKNAHLNLKEGIEYIDKNIHIVALKQQLDSSLDNKIPTKKIKI